MSGWKIRLTVKRLPDGRAELSATTHLPKTINPAVAAGFTEQSIAIGPEGSGESVKTAFEWACRRLQRALGYEG